MNFENLLNLFVEVKHTFIFNIRLFLYFKALFFGRPKKSQYIYQKQYIHIGQINKHIKAMYTMHKTGILMHSLENCFW